jgi:hypothetical protein
MDVGSGGVDGLLLLLLLLAVPMRLSLLLLAVPMAACLLARGLQQHACWRANVTQRVAPPRSGTVCFRGPHNLCITCMASGMQVDGCACHQAEDVHSTLHTCA